MASKSSTPSFIVTLRLKTKLYQEEKLDKLFEVARQMYNKHLHECFRRYRQLQCDKEWSQFKHLPFTDKNRKNKYKEKIKEFGLTEYTLSKEFTTPMNKYYSTIIPSQVGQKINKNVFQHFNEHILWSNHKMYYKRYGKFNSVEGASNSGLSFKNNKIIYGTRKMNSKVIIDPEINKNDTYMEDALKRKVKYVRLLKDVHKGKHVYHAQIVLEGLPPILPDIGLGRIGIDIGPSTIAYVSNEQAHIQTLAPSVDNIEKRIKSLQRKLERSKRKMNPQNYNDNGTIKKGRREWFFSNHYKKTLSILHDLQCKNKNKRKLDHEILSKEIIKQGNIVLVEKMNWKGLVKRSKETKINEKTGKYQSKSRYGKSISNRAPSMLLNLINQKLSYHGNELYEIKTIDVKASQYHHDIDKYIKDDSKLSKRWKEINGEKVQRDLYSAFVIQSVSESDLKTINKEELVNNYNSFKTNHNIEIDRIRNSNEETISSMGL